VVTVAASTGSGTGAALGRPFTVLRELRRRRKVPVAAVRMENCILMNEGIDSNVVEGGWNMESG